MAKTHLKKLQFSQNRILKMCLDKPSRFSTSELHNEARIEYITEFIQRLSDNFAAYIYIIYIYNNAEGLLTTSILKIFIFILFYSIFFPFKSFFFTFLYNAISKWNCPNSNLFTIFLKYNN